MLGVYLRGNLRARPLPDGTYRRAHIESGATPIDSQAIFATGQSEPPQDTPRYTAPASGARPTPPLSALPSEQRRTALSLLLVGMG